MAAIRLRTLNTVEYGAVPARGLCFGKVKLLVLQLDQLFGRANLRRVGRPRDAGIDDVGGQRQVGCLGLITLGLGLRPQTFNRTSLAAEHVERVADGAAGGKQIENRAGRLRALLHRRGELSAGGHSSLACGKYKP